MSFWEAGGRRVVDPVWAFYWRLDTSARDLFRSIGQPGLPQPTNPCIGLTGPMDFLLTIVRVE
jgi:hypothetical protein